MTLCVVHGGRNKRESVCDMRVRHIAVMALVATVLTSERVLADVPVGTGTVSETSELLPPGETRGWVPAGSSVSATATPDAASSTFKNWTGDIEAAEIADDTISFSVHGPRRITATFLINEYDVMFVPGTLGDRIGGGELVQQIKHGMAATAPIVEANPGYTFENWDIAFDNVTEALTVNALYTTNDYTLTFDSTGGSFVTDITQPFGTAITPPTDPTRTGYSFAGWNPSVPSTMPLDGGHHVATWTANDYSLIIISAHGDPSPAAGTNWFEYGQTVAFSISGSPEIIEHDSKFEVTSWVGTGSAPATGTETSGSFVIEENSTINWQWSTNYWVEFTIQGE